MHIISTLNIPKNTQVLLFKPLFKANKNKSNPILTTHLQIKGNITTTFLILPKTLKIGETFSDQRAADVTSNPKRLRKKISFFFSCGKVKNTNIFNLAPHQTLKLYNSFFSTINFLNKEFQAVNFLSIKNLHIFGFGYRAYLSKSKNTLGLKLGFSHKIYMKMRKYQKLQKINRYNITLLGPFQDLLAQTSSDIRKFRVPDAYKGKGVRFLGEKISFKVGKKAQDR